MHAILLLLIVGNYEIQDQSGLQWYNVYTKFCENRSTGSKVAMGATQTAWSF
jgi:hypothetical protein